MSVIFATHLSSGYCDYPQLIAVVSLGAPVLGTLTCVTPSQSMLPEASYCSGSQLGAYIACVRAHARTHTHTHTHTHCPRGHLAISGDIFGFQTKISRRGWGWGCCSTPYTAQASPPYNKEHSGPNVSSVTIENPCLSVTRFLSLRRP